VTYVKHKFEFIVRLKYDVIQKSDLLPPWSRALLEKLTGSHLVKELPAFHETRRFITAFSSARHLSIS